MKTDHTLPVPPELLDRACDAIRCTAGRIPFDQEGTRLTRDLVAAAMEELNAEATRTLALSVKTSGDGKVLIDGLDRHLALRDFSPTEGAGIAEVLIRSGIAGRASVPDRRSRRFLPAVRLNAPWTWTIAGEGNASDVLPLVAVGRAGSPPWTSLCPVCRQGRLNPVSGEQLFGVEATDFLSCTSCGAKFVPGTGTFCLVSVPHRRDPEWLNLLNRAYTPDEWQQIARAGSRTKIDGDQTRDPGKSGGATGARAGPVDKESLAIDIGNRTLYFIKIPLKVSKRSGDDCFKGRRDTLRTILDLPAFARVRDIAESRYGPYLDTPVGFFLSELKARGDPVYRRFLHAHGDGAFCSFRAEKSPILSRRGVYVVAAAGEVVAAGAAVRPFRESIDDLFGRIPPKACFLDGDPERCRINSLLCSVRIRSGLYIHAIDEEREITRVTTLLSGEIFRTLS